MKIVLFTHPDFVGFRSMPKYANLLAHTLLNRGHEVKMLSPAPYFTKLGGSAFLRKWLGYIDQYVLFPLQVKLSLNRYPSDTLFVFADHALGPWVPLVSKRHHIIHCHDFLAQLSAIGHIEENPTGWTGRKYQEFIRRGYSAGKNFVSVSNKTKNDLHSFLPATPLISEVVYNELNQPFLPLESTLSREKLIKRLGIDLSKGYILHVGGNQWYKNRKGVVQIYEAFRTSQDMVLPLLLVGSSPDLELKALIDKSKYKDNIYVACDLEDEFLNYAYSGASVLLFPSLAEGFGWPIIEAMASGTLVITTNEAAMDEVAGSAAFFIPKVNGANPSNWPIESADVLNKVLRLSPSEHTLSLEKGFKNVERFSGDIFGEKIEKNLFQYHRSNHQPMKILEIIRTMDPESGGPCQGIRNSNPTLAALGAVREVVSLDEPSMEFSSEDNFIIHALGPEQGPWYYSPKFMPWLTDNISRFDVVIMNGLWLYQSYAVWKVISKLRKQGIGVPNFFVMPHGMLDPYFQQAKSRRLKAIRNWVYWKIIENQVVNGADALLFTCQTELLLAREPFRPYRPKREINIGFGVMKPPIFTESMQLAFSHKCPAIAERPYFLFLSRIHEKKGVDMLLKAYGKYAKQLISQGLTPHVLVIAGPGLDSSYGDMIRELALDVQPAEYPILFPGMLSGDAKWGAFYGCEAFILPSHQENFGIAIVEALACKRPVLITNKVNIWMEITESGAGFVADDSEAGTVNLLQQWHNLSIEQKLLMREKAHTCFQTHYAVEPAAAKLYQTLASFI